MRLNTLRETRTTFLTPQRYEEKHCQFYIGVPPSLPQGNLMLYLILQGYGPHTFGMVHKLTKQKLTAKGSLRVFLFSFRFSHFLSLNYLGEIFRRKGHLSRQLCKITDVLWPCFLYCKIISRTCVQFKMGQPSLCFSSGWLC